MPNPFQPSNLFDLAPWEQVAWLDPVKIAVIPIAPTTPGVLALPADPHRVLLILSCDSAVAIVGPDPLFGGSGLSYGLTVPNVSNSVSPLILSAFDVGPIICGQFYAIAKGGASNLTVITQSVPNWPDGTDPIEYLRPKTVQAGSPPLSTAPGRPGAWNPLTYWRQLMSRIRGK